MERLAPRLMMITGPIASGKSTLASLVAEGARQRGLTVALTDLDGVAEMALPSLPAEQGEFVTDDLPGWLAARQG